MNSFIGCYAIPVLWQYRILLFIGEITQKTAPNTSALSSTFGSMVDPTSSSNNTATDVQPSVYWEIKLSWREYRSGKWTQKQTVTDPIQTTSFQPNTGTEYTDADPIPVDTFQFLPQIVTDSNQNQTIIIQVWSYASVSSPNFYGEYIFDGTIVQKSGAVTSTQPPTAPSEMQSTSFHLIGG